MARSRPPTILMMFVLTLLFAAISAVAMADPMIPRDEAELPDRAKGSIPKEPGWKHPSYRGWELISVPGLIATYYDLDLDGQLDYSVIRKIIRKASSEETTLEEAIRVAKFDHLSIFVSNPIIYFTKKNPLFYCRGLDFRKNCQNIWVDVAEDGLNGNETYYTLTLPNYPVR